MNKILFTILAPVLFSLPAQAVFELRAGYGINTPAEDTIGTNTLKTMTGFNVDGIIEVPTFPLGLGLRYESMGFDVNQIGVSANIKSEMTRLSAIINYRIIDLFAYFGLIGTLGFMNDLTVKIPQPASNIDYKTDLTYSAGVEGGFNFGTFSLGAELGYFFGNYETQNSNTTVPEIDLDGVYLKILAGIDF